LLIIVPKHGMEKDSFTIHDLPRSERPRERLNRLGPDALSSPELLALLVGRGIAGKSALHIGQELLSRFGNVKAISEATIEELSTIRGVGIAKAVQLKACFELGKRQWLEPEEPGLIDIRNPADVAKAIRASIQDKAKEHFKLVLLNTRNRITGIFTVSIGTLNASLVHPREVFRRAIQHAASSVVLAHNHPSGNPEPSDDDITLTRRLCESGRLLGIEVIDHIIVAKDEFVSFKAKGIL
jgi:DNA repair protein RadC